MLALGIVSLAAQTGTEPFPIDEPFTGADFNDPNWELGGEAELTAAGGEDEPGEGWLRLTDAEPQSYGTAILNAAFPADLGLVVEFEYATYGGTGADGMAFILFDGIGGEPGGGRLGRRPRLRLRHSSHTASSRLHQRFRRRGARRVRQLQLEKGAQLPRWARALRQHRRHPRLG